MGFVIAATLARTSDALAEFPVLIIEEVTVGSPAARAGFKMGDKLLTYDDKPLYVGSGPRFCGRFQECSAETSLSNSALPRPQLRDSLSSRE
jgi:hypothetical protein